MTQTQVRLGLPQPPPLTGIEVIRRRAREARDDQYYNKLHALQRFISGDAQAVQDILNGYTASYAGDPDLGDYPDVQLDLGPQSVQNHGLISSRINIQAIVYADPEFHCVVDEPLIRDVNQSYFRTRWEEGDWGNIFYEIGMDVESCGIGFAELGITAERKLTVQRRSPLDMLWDTAHRSPGEWRYFFSRTRLDIDDAIEKYGHAVSRERLEGLSRPVRTGSLNYTDGGLTNLYGSYGEAKYVHEWSYWDKNTHCVFLGSIQGDGEYLSYGADLVYRTGRIGPNPFGVIPFAVWIDSWSPGVKRPVGKAETTWRTATMINALELYIKETIKRGVPVNLVSTFGLRPDQIKQFQQAEGIEDIAKIILMDMPDVANAIHRTEPLDLPPHILQVRNMLKEELNASTGVSDSQKGQPLPGEKTAFEVRQLTQAQGVQARHTRRQFSRFLQQVTTRGRWIGARYDTAPSIFYIPDGLMDTRVIPLKPFLAHPLQIIVQENSLQYTTEEDRKNQRLMQFQTVDLPGIQAGVCDPRKVFRDVYKKLDMRDPDTLMYSDAELAQMRAEAEAEAQRQQLLGMNGETATQNGEGGYNEAEQPPI